MTATACVDNQDKLLRCELNWIGNTISLSDSAYYFESLELFMNSDQDGSDPGEKNDVTIYPEHKIYSWSVDFNKMGLKEALKKGGEGSTLSLRVRKKNENKHLAPLLFNYYYSYKDTTVNIYLKFDWH